MHFCSGCLWRWSTVGRAQPSTFRLALPKLSKRAASHNVPLSLAIPLQSCHLPPVARHHQTLIQMWWRGFSELTYSTLSFHTLLYFRCIQMFFRSSKWNGETTWTVYKIGVAIFDIKHFQSARKTSKLYQPIYFSLVLLIEPLWPRPRTSFEKQKSSNLETVKRSNTGLSLDNNLKRS